MSPGRTDPIPELTPGGVGQLEHLEFPELLFVAIFLPIASFSWVGILLAELNAFSGWRVGLGGGALSAAAIAWALRDLRSTRIQVAPIPRSRWLLIGALLIAGTALFAQPGEYLIEGSDASVYLATGRHINTTGGITYSDPLVSMMPTELRASFFAAGSPGQMHEALLPGGLPLGADDTVQPSFFHLFPVWVAIATVVAGPYGGYYVNVGFAVLGLATVVLIGRRLWAAPAGLVAGALLALNFGQILYARLPSSEILAQFFSLATIFFALLALDHRSRLAGACAGTAAGLAAFTRVDAFILIVLPAVAWLAASRRGQRLGRAWFAFALLLIAVSSHAALHGVTASYLYTSRLVGEGWPRLLRVLTHFGPLTSIVLAVAGGAAVWLAMKYGRRSLLPVAVCAVLAFAVLPTPMLVVLTRLLTTGGLTAAVAGLVFVFVARWDARVLTLLAPLFIQTAVLLMWTETVIFPTDLRRAVPLMLPGLSLLIGFLVTYLSSWPPLTKAVWILPLALAINLCLDSAAIIRMPLMQGVEAQVAQLAHAIPPDSVTVLDGSVPGHLPLALHYGFNRPSLRMRERPSASTGISPLIHAALATGKPVFVAAAALNEATPRGLQRSDFADFDIVPLTTVPLHYTVLAPVRFVFPRRYRTDSVSVTVYKVTARDRETTVPLPLVVDVGGDDFRSLVEGFHGPEQLQASTARWTNGNARLAVPRLARSTGTMTLVLRASAHRPAGHPAAVVEVAVDDIIAGTVTGMTSDLREFRLPLPSAVQRRLLEGPTTLWIRSDSFVPKDAGMNTDGRRLGIVIDWIRIE